MTSLERQQAAAIRKWEECLALAMNGIFAMAEAFAEAQTPGRAASPRRPTLELVKDVDLAGVDPESAALDQRAQAEIASAKARGEELSYLDALRRLTGD
jgi:hypothetical protein